MNSIYNSIVSAMYGKPVIDVYGLKLPADKKVLNNLTDLLNIEHLTQYKTDEAPDNNQFLPLLRSSGIYGDDNDYLTTATHRFLSTYGDTFKTMLVNKNNRAFNARSEQFAYSLSTLTPHNDINEHALVLAKFIGDVVSLAKNNFLTTTSEWQNYKSSNAKKFKNLSKQPPDELIVLKSNLSALQQDIKDNVIDYKNLTDTSYNYFTYFFVPYCNQTKNVDTARSIEDFAINMQQENNISYKEYSYETLQQEISQKILEIDNTILDTEIKKKK